MYEAIFDLKMSERARRVRESLMKEPVALVSSAKYSEKARVLGFFCEARWLTGAYSEFFNRLEPCQQLELIRRTENNV